MRTTEFQVVVDRGDGDLHDVTGGRYGTENGEHAARAGAIVFAQREFVQRGRKHRVLVERREAEIVYDSGSVPQ